MTQTILALWVRKTPAESACFKNAMTLHEFSFIVKDKLGSPAVLVTGDLKREVRHIALVGGDGKSFFPAAVDAGADVFVDRKGKL